MFGMNLTGGSHATGWELIERRTIAAATRNILFSNLNTTNNEYLFIMQLYNSALADTNVSLEFNADTTVTNYYRQVASANTAVINCARINDNTIFAINTGECTLGEILIVQDPGHDSYVRAFTWANNGDPTVVLMQWNALAWVTAGPATQINFYSTTNLAFGIGTIISLYRLSR